MSLGKIALEDLAEAVGRIEGDRATLDKVLDTLGAAGIRKNWVFRAVAGDIQVSACEGTAYAFRITKTPITDLPNALTETAADSAA